MQWFTGARIGDILPLRRENVKWISSTRELTVTIDAGKVMAKRQPYTVETVISPEFAEMLTEYLDVDLKEKDFLFPFTAISRADRLDRLNSALKQVDPSLSSRSIRRGALQAMALNGRKLEDIMLFSGPKSKNTSLRYLDWGRCFGEGKKLSAKAAAFLSPLPTTSH